MSNNLNILVAADFSQISEELQEKIYYEYYEYVYGMIYCIVKDHATTEDIIQDAFIKIITKKPIFENEIKLKAWLKVVTRNTSINFLRKNKKHRNQLDIDSVYTYIDEVLQSPVSVEHSVESKMMEDSILTYINSLKPEFRVLIEYRWKQGLSYKEMSELLDLREDIIKQRLFRARENIKKMMHKEWGVLDERRKI
ncbi:RNA polymerase subunit sigma-24 [Paenibacillus macquariensis subsp. defensor]|nr:RNA polymerase subunit sigma-24 [Paenibacillus macquariensis subsp. defensor]